MADYRLDQRQRQWGATSDARPIPEEHKRANIFCMAARSNDTEQISRLLVDGVVPSGRDAVRNCMGWSGVADRGGRAVPALCMPCKVCSALLAIRRRGMPQRHGCWVRVRVRVNA